MKLAYYADQISPHRAETPEGYLVVLGTPIAKANAHQVYAARELQPSGVEAIDKLAPNTPIEVYRDEKDIFDPIALASFNGKAVTKTHPPEFVSIDNDGQYRRGFITNVRRGDTLPDGSIAVIGDLVITDQQLRTLIENGAMDELSCGYTYRLEIVPDEHSSSIRLKMVEVRGNHLAVVPSGRAGDYVKVLDAKPPEERTKTVKEELAAVGDFFKNLGLRLVAADAESATVETQKKQDQKSNEMKERTLDATKEQELTAAKDAALKRAKDAEEKVEQMEAAAKEKEQESAAKDAGEKIEEVKKEAAKEKEAVDSRFKSFEASVKKLISDAVGEVKEIVSSKTEGGDAKECTCDAAEGAAHKEGCPTFSKPAEDADLIPVATLKKEDRPKNPIPGADSTTVEALRKLRPMIADSFAKGLIDKPVVEAFNRAMDAAKKNQPATANDYAAILSAANSEGKLGKSARERSTVIPVGDAKQGDYESQMKKYHRTNPQDWGKAATTVN
jgi:hypothetical protein